MRLNLAREMMSDETGLAATSSTAASAATPLPAVEGMHVDGGGRGREDADMADMDRVFDHIVHEVLSALTGNLPWLAVQLDEFIRDLSYRQPEIEHAEHQRRLAIYGFDASVLRGVIRDVLREDLDFGGGGGGMMEAEDW